MKKQEQEAAVHDDIISIMYLLVILIVASMKSFSAGWLAGLIS
jgi:hypothetical protein